MNDPVKAFFRHSRLAVWIWTALVGVMWGWHVIQIRHEVWWNARLDLAVYTVGCAILWGLGIVGVRALLTRRKQCQRGDRELATADRQERLHALGDGADSVALVTADLEGQDLRILSFGPDAQRTFGYAPEEAVGRPVAMLWREEDAEELAAAYEAVRQGRRHCRETVLVRKSGETFPALLTFHPHRNARQQIIGVVGVVHDITERNSAMAELATAWYEAQAANRAKSEFLAIMSHELRTPLNAILGFSEILLEQTRQHALDDVQKGRLAKIHQSGRHLLGMVNDILDLADLETGKLAVLERCECSPSQIIDEVAEQMQARAHAKHLTLETEYAGRLPATVWTNAARLRQILVNVVGNAVVFTERGGVRLIARCIASDRPSLQIDVVDTGVGMTPEQAEQAFRLFTQADSSATRQHGGVGIGLTLAKRYAQMLGGDVSIVQTGPGIGTRMRVSVAAGPLERGKTCIATAPACGVSWIAESASRIAAAHDCDPAQK